MVLSFFTCLGKVYIPNKIFKEFIPGHRFSVGISSKPWFLPKTDINCQFWAHILRTKFVQLFLWVVTSTDVNKTKYWEHFFKQNEITNCINYFFSKVKSVGGDAFFIIKYHFHNNMNIVCLFEYFTNSCLCQVFVTKTDYVTVPEFLLNFTIFCEW